jgi:hypothetical protein
MRVAELVRALTMFHPDAEVTVIPVAAISDGEVDMDEADQMILPGTVLCISGPDAVLPHGTDQVAIEASRVKRTPAVPPYRTLEDHSREQQAYWSSLGTSSDELARLCGAVPEYDEPRQHRASRECHQRTT